MRALLVINFLSHSFLVSVHESIINLSRRVLTYVSYAFTLINAVASRSLTKRVSRRRLIFIGLAFKSILHDRL
ncbi:DNA repair endonuclease XPF [Fusarium oxysporum f. sp. albedinis]|nr:DNA repair endonuclease XPF [Fusarium oxysporum f. sp. albedinis]